MERHNSRRGGELHSSNQPEEQDQLSVDGSELSHLDHDLIYSGIVDALHEDRPIGHVIARRIAAKLDEGPGTALHALASRGVLSTRLHGELDSFRTADMPAELAPWLDALDGYLVAYAADPEPVTEWSEPEGAPLPAGSRDGNEHAPAPTVHVPGAHRDQQALTSIRRLSTYEPPLLPTVPEVALTPTVRPEADMSRSTAFQVMLDMQWGRDHRPDSSDGLIASADVEATWFILTAAVDVLAGRRPAEQIRHKLSPLVFAALQTRAREAARTATGFRFRSLHACQPVGGVIEACGTVWGGSRSQALVARLEMRRRGWQCVLLRLL